MSVITQKDLDDAAELSAQQRLLTLQLHAAEARIALDMARPLLAVAPEPFRTVFTLLSSIVDVVLR